MAEPFQPPSCEEDGCIWPCHHHLHTTLTHGTAVLAHHLDVSDPVLQRCKYCSALYAVALTFCPCRYSEAGANAECANCSQFNVFLEPSKDGKRIAKMRIESRTHTYIENVQITTTSSAVVPSRFSWLRRRFLKNVAATTTMPLVPWPGEAAEASRSNASMINCKRWFEECRADHALCASSTFDTKRSRPQRLLDIRGFENTGTIRLIATGEQDYDFAALSYCWGSTGPPKLLRATERSYSGGFDSQSLPKGFQHAMFVASSLGIGYLWIDSLCIVQDDQEDWEVESANMGVIFSGAQIVIIIANAKDPYEGFLRESKERKRHAWRTIDPPTAADNSTLASLKARPTISHHSIDARINGPIAGRAWAYQERLLARRCLIFCEGETVWECRQHCQCDCHPHGTSFEPQLLYTKVSWGDPSQAYFHYKSDAYSYWRRHVAEYSACQLTQITDRLPAFSALASVIGDRTEDTYMAGLWRDDLLHQLMWFSGYSPRFNRPYDTYIGPTWSWASHPHRMNYVPLHYVEKDHVIARVVDAASEVEGLNPYGIVRAAYVKLEGIGCNAIVSVRRQSTSEAFKINIVLADGHAIKANPFYEDSSILDKLPIQRATLYAATGATTNILQRKFGCTWDEQDECSGRVHLFWLTKHCFLVLASSRKKPGTYERLGIAFDPDVYQTADKTRNDSQFFPKAIRERTTEEVKII